MSHSSESIASLTLNLVDILKPMHEALDRLAFRPLLFLSSFPRVTPLRLPALQPQGTFPHISIQ